MKKPDSEETILFIEYQNGEPFNVVTDEGDYAIERCGGEDGDFHCYNSGSGGNFGESFDVSKLCNPTPVTSAIWVAQGCKLHRYGKKKDVPITSKKQLLDMGYKWLDEPLDLTEYLNKYEREKGETTCNPFKIADEIYEGFVYCSVCDCNWIADSESECRHIFWSKGGYYCGVGSDEGKIEDAKEDILFFASKIKDQILVEMIKALENNSFWLRFHGSILGPVDIELNGDCDHIFNILDGFSEDDLKTDEEYSKMEDGGYWLVSLEAEKTKEANTKVAQWLKESLKINKK